MKLDYKVGKIEHLPSALDSSSLLHRDWATKTPPSQGVINYPRTHHDYCYYKTIKYGDGCNHFPPISIQNNHPLGADNQVSTWLIFPEMKTPIENTKWLGTYFIWIFAPSLALSSCGDLENFFHVRIILIDLERK